MNISEQQIKKVLVLFGALLVLISTLTGCKLLSELAPVHEDTSHVHDWLVVPVHYASIRKRAQTKEIDFLEKRSDPSVMQFGVKNVLIPLPKQPAISNEVMEKMGWKLIHLEKALPNGKKPVIPGADGCPIADREYSGKDVVSKFDKYRERSGSDRVIFFAHGCCATFKASLERSARIAAAMQIPLVVFDWDSPKGFSKYLENETLAEQSYDDFYDFLNSVEKVVPPKNTILISHSMGAHFLNDALLRRSERTRLGLPVEQYNEVIYSQPDIDARSYIRHNANVASQAAKTRIYFNSTDGRLDASATAHGGFERLGRPESLLDKLCKLESQDMIDITGCALGHEIVFWALADFTHGNSTKHAGYETVQINPHLFALRKAARFVAK